MQLIKLHVAKDYPVYINPYQIVSIADFRKVGGMVDNHSSIVLTNGKFQVTGTIEEIYEIINNTKLLIDLFNTETL